MEGCDVEQKRTHATPWTAYRALALAAAAALLPAGSCDDNLGQGSPGPLVFRISTGTDTLEANDLCETPSISPEGRFVAFASKANNLALPRSTFKEAFLKDRWLDAVENISQVSTIIATPTDCVNPVVSADGNRVAFETKANMKGIGVVQATSNIFLRDRSTGNLQAVIGAPWPNANLVGASLSSDGKILVFQSSATNLPIANPGGTSQIYAADMSGAFPPPLTIVSRSTLGPGTFCNNQCFLARISTDGKFVTFTSAAIDLDPAGVGPPSNLQVYVGTPTGALCELVSRASGAGAQGNATSVWSAISGDGRFVAFSSLATNLTPAAAAGSIAVRDRSGGGTTLLAASDAYISNPPIIGLMIDRCGISDDGQFVAYRSTASQIQLAGVQTGSVAVLSIGFGGALANNVNRQFFFTDLSGDGRWVAWQADSTNLILNDTNAVTDIYGYGPLR
jgi:hypothetical protein